VAVNFGNWLINYYKFLLIIGLVGIYCCDPPKYVHTKWCKTKVKIYAWFMAWVI